MTRPWSSISLVTVASVALAANGCDGCDGGARVRGEPVAEAVVPAPTPPRAPTGEAATTCALVRQKASLVMAGDARFGVAAHASTGFLIAAVVSAGETDTLHVFRAGVDEEPRPISIVPIASTNGPAAAEPGPRPADVAPAVEPAPAHDPTVAEPARGPRGTLDAEPSAPSPPAIVSLGGDRALAAFVDRDGALRVASIDVRPGERLRAACVVPGLEADRAAAPALARLGDRVVVATRSVDGASVTLASLSFAAGESAPCSAAAAEPRTIATSAARVSPPTFVDGASPPVVAFADERSPGGSAPLVRIPLTPTGAPTSAETLRSLDRPDLSRPLSVALGRRRARATYLAGPPERMSLRSFALPSGDDAVLVEPVTAALAVRGDASAVVTYAAGEKLFAMTVDDEARASAPLLVRDGVSPAAIAVSADREGTVAVVYDAGDTVAASYFGCRAP